MTAWGASPHPEAFDRKEGSNVNTPQVVRRLTCGVATVVLAGLALVGLGGAPAGAAPADKDTYTTISIQAGSGAVAQTKSAMRLTSTRAQLAADHLPGAYILCEIASPLGIRATGVNVEVEWRMACRWTDDNTLAPEVVLNEMVCAIYGPPNGTLYGVARKPSTGPTGSCQAAYPQSQLLGTFSGVTQAVVFLSGDPTPYYSPVYQTTNSVTIV